MSQYTVYVTPAALREIKRLPGNMRQRVKRAVGNLADAPRPSHSKALNMPDQDLRSCHDFGLYQAVKTVLTAEFAEYAESFKRKTEVFIVFLGVLAVRLLL